MPSHTIRTLIVYLSLLGMTSIAAAQSAELDEVKAVNQAYYIALSARDLAAMEQVWSRASMTSHSSADPASRTYRLGHH